MSIKRRDFLKMSGAGMAVAAFGGLGFSLKPTEAKAQLTDLRKGKQTTSICCYCAVGCGLIVSTDEKTKRSINVEGDPEHPINQGSLCAKGASIWQLGDSERRVDTPLYRAPGAKEFKKVSWEWAYEEIAKRVKKVRDESF